MVTDIGKLRRAEQSILNGVYAAIAWLLLDFGLLFQEHGAQALGVLASRPEMIAGSIIVIACVVGLLYKSRTAASALFLLLLLPALYRAVQGVHPPVAMVLFSLVLLYFFLSAVLGTFKYHELIKVDRKAGGPD